MSCCRSGETATACCCLNYCHPALTLPHCCIAHNWTVLAGWIKCKRSDHGPICFSHDNARPLFANLTCQKLLELDWKCLSTHPGPQTFHSPTIIFFVPEQHRAIQGLLQRWCLESMVEGLICLQAKTVDCDGRQDLPKTWLNVIGCAGDYIYWMKILYLIKIWNYGTFLKLPRLSNQPNRKRHFPTMSGHIQKSCSLISHLKRKPCSGSFLSGAEWFRLS